MKKIERLSFNADMDSFRSLFRRAPSGGYSNAEYARGVDAMVEFARMKGFRWTLFVVGHDLLVEENCAALRRAAAEGHEIACHSMTHPQGFRWLSGAEKENELKRFNEILGDRLGLRASGFRAPGWNMSDDAVLILIRSGYRYDSSVFPTMLAPALKFLHWFSTRSRPREERTTMGQASYALAPVQPYRSSLKRLGKKGTDGIWEFPVTVTPGLRLPFFATYHLARGYAAFRSDLNAIVQHSVQFVQYQFHLMDFVDCVNEPLSSEVPCGSSGVYVAQAVRTSLSRKMSLWSRIVDALLSETKATVRLCDEVPE